MIRVAPQLVTRLPMPAEGGGAAGRDRPQGPMLRPA